MSSIQHGPRSAADNNKRPIQILASKRPNAASTTPVILLNRPPPPNNSTSEAKSNGGGHDLTCPPKKASASTAASSHDHASADALDKLGSLDIGSESPLNTKQEDSSPAAPGAPATAPLDHTLVDALRSSRDRIFLLRQEQEMHDFVLDLDRQEMLLPLMNSYQRLLVHRCAETFSLERDVDPETKAVSLKKTVNTRIPPMRLIQVYNQQQTALKPTDISPFAVLNRSGNASVNPSQCPSPTMRSEACSPSLEQSEASSTAASTSGTTQPKTSFRIMRRDPSLGNGNSALRAASAATSDTGSTSEPRPKARKDMTIEEREAAYREARERIFGPTTTETDASASAVPGAAGKAKENRTASVESSSNGNNKLPVGPDGGLTSPSTSAAHVASQGPSWATQQADSSIHASPASLQQPTGGLPGSLPTQQWNATPGYQPSYHMNAGAPVFQSSQAPMQGGFSTPTPLPPNASLPPRWPPYATDGGFGSAHQGYHVQQQYDTSQQGQPLPPNAAANGIYQWQMHPQLLREHALPSGSPVNSFTRLSNGSMSNLSNCDAFSPFPPTPSATSSAGVPSPAPSVAGSSVSARGVGSRHLGRPDRTNNRTGMRGAGGMLGLEERRMPGITRRDSSTSGAGTECSSAGGGSVIGPPSSVGGADSEADFAGPMSTAFTTARAHNWLQGQQQQQQHQQESGRQAAGLGTPSAASDASLSPAAQMSGGTSASPLPRSESQSPVAGRAASVPARRDQVEDGAGGSRSQGGGRLNVGDRTLFDPNAARCGAPSSSASGSSASATAASGVSSPVVLSVGKQGRYRPQQPPVHQQQQPPQQQLQFQQVAQQQQVSQQQQHSFQGGLMPMGGVPMPMQSMAGMVPQGQAQYPPLPQQQQQGQAQAQVPMVMTMMMMVPASQAQQQQQQQPMWVPVWQPQAQAQQQGQMPLSHPGQVMQNVTMSPPGQFVPQQQQQQSHVLQQQPLQQQQVFQPQQYQGVMNGGQHHVGAPFVGPGPQMGPLQGQRQQYQQPGQGGVGQQQGRTLRIGAMRPAQSKQTPRGGLSGPQRSTGAGTGGVVRQQSSEGNGVAATVSPSTTPSLPAAVASLPARPDWVLSGGSDAYGSGSSANNSATSRIVNNKTEQDKENGGSVNGGQSTPRSLSRSPSSVSGESRASVCRSRSRSRTHSRSASMASIHSSRSSSLGPSASASNMGDLDCEDDDRFCEDSETAADDGLLEV